MGIGLSNASFFKPQEGPTEETDWTPGQAFRFCARVVSSRQKGLFYHSKRFPAILPGILPKTLRPHYNSIRAFSLFADDFAHDPQYLENLRPAFLENWESQLLQCTWRKPTNPVFVALRETIEQFDLPVPLFQDLLMARKLDVVNQRFSNFDELLRYTHVSSRPFGRLGLLLLGKKDPELARLSDLLCTGIQLVCFWKNIGADMTRNRVYIPVGLMDKHGCSEQDLAAGRASPGLGPLMKEVVSRTREFLFQGHPLCVRLDFPMRFELNRIILSGERILEILENRRGDQPPTDPDLDWTDHLILALRALKGPRSRNTPGGKV